MTNFLAAKENAQWAPKFIPTHTRRVNQRCLFIARKKNQQKLKTGLHRRLQIILDFSAKTARMNDTFPARPSFESQTSTYFCLEPILVPLCPIVFSDGIAIPTRYHRQDGHDLNLLPDFYKNMLVNM